VPAKRILFTEHELVPNGKAEGVRYIIFVDPARYREVPTVPLKVEIGRCVSRLNKLLEDEAFVLMGPGRWGSANLDLGVRVSYADIHNTKVLIEIALETEGGGTPELSYGTHFFQDLVEAGIHALPIHLNRPKTQFNWSFFRTAPNILLDISPGDAELEHYVRVIDIANMSNNTQRLNILMDSATDEALGYLADGEWPVISGVKMRASLSSF
jgi:hypothetical protein